MKKMVLIVTGLLLSLFMLPAQQATVDLNEQLQFTQLSNQSIVAVDNINGSIQVEGYSGDEVILEITKTIKGKKQAYIDLGMKELDIHYEEIGDTLFITMDFPCEEVDGSIRRRKSNRGIYWNNCRWDPPYQFKLDFKLKVPQQINLFLSTINNGDILVDGINGALKICNINGDVTLKNISGGTMVETINGDVDLNYARNPQVPSRYFTHNGTITANYQSGLSATMLFKSFHGDFYTDIEDIKVEPNRISKRRDENVDHLSILVEAKTEIKARSGAVLLDFETFNGDIYVKEN